MWRVAMNVDVEEMRPLRRQTFRSKVLRQVSSPGGVVWSGAGRGQLLPLSVEVFKGITFHLLSVLASQDAVKGVWVTAHQHGHHRTQSPITAAWVVRTASQVHRPVHWDEASHPVAGVPRHGGSDAVV